MEPSLFDCIFFILVDFFGSIMSSPENSPSASSSLSSSLPENPPPVSDSETAQDVIEKKKEEAKEEEISSKIEKAPERLLMYWDALAHLDEQIKEQNQVICTALIKRQDDVMQETTDWLTLLNATRKQLRILLDLAPQTHVS